MDLPSLCFAIMGCEWLRSRRDRRSAPFIFYVTRRATAGLEDVKKSVLKFAANSALKKSL
jgi:hypothetical protein